MVSKQLVSQLEANDIFKKVLCGSCKWHSTENALLNILNDILMHANQGEWEGMGSGSIYQ